MKGRFIANVVSEYYKTDLTNKSRHHSVVRPRQIAMYLCHKFTRLSYSQIGNIFGGYNHTTVMNAVFRINDLLTFDEFIENDVNKIMEILNDR